jgi:hypothetical protein
MLRMWLPGVVARMVSSRPALSLLVTLTTSRPGLDSAATLVPARPYSSVPAPSYSTTYLPAGCTRASSWNISAATVRYLTFVSPAAGSVLG